LGFNHGISLHFPWPCCSGYTKGKYEFIFS
jgi:hypothetical protein